MAVILIAENEPDIRQALTMLLRRSGHQVHYADDGDEALARASTARADLLVMNPSLPGLNGLDVCRRLRLDPGTADLPILLVSVHQYPAEQRAAYDAGADDYLGKPFHPHDLLSRVEALLTVAKPAADSGAPAAPPLTN
jgi:DNA-binding response OmpR family regulator